MALILADGFDFYNSSTDAQYVGSPWAQFNGIAGAAATPYNVGQSMYVNNPSIAITQSNDTVIYFAFSTMTSSTFVGASSSGLTIDMMDGTNIQCTLKWSGDGNFYVHSNGWNSSILNGAGWPHGMAANSWCHWQVKLVINNTTGSVELRKNNNPVNDYTVTGLNTRNNSTNSYANRYTFAAGGAQTWNIDDLIMCSGTGATLNTWPGQLRAIQLMANGDVQKVMTPSIGATQTVGDNSTANSMGVSANTIMFPPTNYGRVIQNVVGTVTKITVKFQTGFTGKVRCALYNCNASTLMPTTFIAQTVEVTNPVSGDNDFTFTTPPVLTAAGTYAICWWSDTANTVYHAGGAINVQSQSLTYAPTFPATVTTVTGGNATPSIYATIANANCGMVDELHMNSDTDYVYSSNPGDTDMYDLDDMTVNPISIPLVVSKVSMRKSDTGSRTACSRIKSGSFVQDQPSVNLATTYGWQMIYLTTDPNTSAGWTQAGVNAFQLGAKVVT